MGKKLSLIISVFNEEDALPLFFPAARKVLETLGEEWELLFVNDGSIDGSRALLYRMAQQDPRVRVVHFSRNFGHEAAMIAGIDHASGDALICMDADLQHPVQCIPEILKKIEDGYDVVSMVRTANRSAGPLKNLTSNAFYTLINALSGAKFQKNASDFFGISARAAEVLRFSYRERVRFLRGYVQTIGFPSTVLYYEAADRAAGHSKYSIRKLFRFSMNTIVSFSDLPLRLASYAGVFSGLLGFLLLCYSVYMKLRYGAPAGYTTLVVVICFMFSIQFLLLGIMGQYIGILFQEVKGRPLYLVEERLNFPADSICAADPSAHFGRGQEPDTVREYSENPSCRNL